VNDLLSKLLPEYVDFLAQLVRIESVYGKERTAQEFVKKKMEAAGLGVECFFSRQDQESMNLVSRIPGNRPGCRSLILNAHNDVAPVDEETAWVHPPFSGKIVDNILMGGAARMTKQAWRLFC